MDREAFDKMAAQERKAAARAVTVAAAAVKAAAEIAHKGVEGDRASIQTLLTDSALMKRALLGETVQGVSVSSGLVAEVRKLKRQVYALAAIIPTVMYGKDPVLDWLRGAFS